MSRKNRKQQPKMPRRPPHVVDAAEFARHAMRPGLAILHVAHDDWCAFLNDRGECDCSPDLKLIRPFDEEG